MGAGDPDFYKAFAWRFWQLVHRHGGRIGVVLPRPALMAKGSAEWRQEVFASATGVDIATLTNRRQWVFPEVHPQYTIGLVALERGDHRGTLSLQGPFASREQYDEGIGGQAATFETADVLTWSDTAALPLLPSADSIQIAQRLEWLGEHAEVVRHHALTGNLRGLYRLRSGDYRVVYQLLREERAIVVVAIGDRREIYRKR